MVNRNIILGAAFLCLFYGICLSQKTRRGIPITKFTCHGRASGYYADIETDCQVYHMCDGLGRQFSYTCPNTTLFQQRMLICDHWYMVNCSRSEQDYDANLLIGQRDKPFVSDAEMSLRTPRPDILSVPPNNNYYDGLKEAETKFPVHPDNNIVGIGDTILSHDNNGLDSAKHQYRPPSSWSTGTSVKNNNNHHNNQNNNNNNDDQQEHKHHHHHHNSDNNNQNTNVNNFGQRDPNHSHHHFHHNSGNRDQHNFQHGNQNTNFGNNGPKQQNHNTNNQAQGSINHEHFDRDTTNMPDNDNLTGAASQDTRPTFQPTPSFNRPTIPPPSQELSPPLSPKRESSEEFDLDIRMKDEDPVYNFIKRFDPNSPNSHKTAMTATEIIDINRQLPTNHDVSNEDERTPRRNKDVGNHFNILPKENKAAEGSRFDSVNQKGVEDNGIKAPERVLLPPKKDQSELPSTTMGPPIYYEWKWAVPALDLEPPKQNNATSNNSISPQLDVKRPFSNLPSTTPKTVKVNQPNTEYNTSSYFVPDYIFPLDKEHPGYESDNAETSFRVKVSRPGRASYGENPACPQCHPAYLQPGSCEPCIVKR